MEQPHCKRDVSELYDTALQTQRLGDIHPVTDTTLQDATKAMHIVQNPAQYDCFDSNTLQSEYHQTRVDNFANEAVMNSHGRHCHAKGKGCACCPYLPHLNASFDFSTNQSCVDLATTVANTPQSNVVSAIRTPLRTSMRLDDMQYSYPSFGSGRQSTVLSQRSNGSSAITFDMADAATSTPRRSYVSTPDTIYSNASSSNGIRRTPKSAMPGSTKQVYNGLPQSNQTISPSQVMRSAQNKRLFQDVEDIDAQLSEARGDFNLLQEQAFGQLDAYGYGGDAGESESEYQEVEGLATGQSSQLQNATFFSSDDLHPQNAYVATFGTTANPTLGQEFWGIPSTMDYNSPCFQPSNAYQGAAHAMDYQQAPSMPEDLQTYGLPSLRQPDYGHEYAQYKYPQPATLPSNDAVTPDPTRARQRTSARGKTPNDALLNELLTRLRGEGKSYKAITLSREFQDYVAETGHNLTESTLRGRYRSMTKRANERVRKPEWPKEAVAALVAAVDYFRLQNNPNSTNHKEISKIPWKAVAERMQKRDGCYLYGNATVKKKYCELTGIPLKESNK